MCGGEMELEEGATVAECPYCMTKQTLPKLDNDKRANMYDRANHFRRQNEYDKAMALFESILQEDRTDAEAYWSLVLCRYGIEYVEDPTSRKRIPTVNRVQFTSILADEDYKSALEYADATQRTVYESEAKTIDEIQKGILSISKQEDPFDVFICYKETDASGRRTPDSVLANDLYHELSKEGFKVFFSRITLEDKIGTAYEPYIFAASNSAKVMVVLGTKPEYFNAVWVRNEWSRYLALIRAGADKTLVPAYRDMDPYDLPDEFSHLQAQDMSKLGFMQDLIRGIKKITALKTPDENETSKEARSNNEPLNKTAPLLRRAKIFIEDGDWASADEYAEKVLDLEPENSRAYVIKLLAEKRAHSIDEIIQSKVPLDDNGNYKKALRFSEGDENKEIKRWNTAILEAIESDRLKALLNDILVDLSGAETISDYEKVKRRLELLPNSLESEQLTEECNRKIDGIIEQNYLDAISYQENKKWKEAIECFSKFNGYKDSMSRINQCQAAQREEQYESALAYQVSGHWKQAIELFSSLGNYKESQIRVVQCQESMAAEERARSAEQTKKNELARKKKKKEMIIALSVLGAIVIISLSIVFIFIPKGHYDRGVELLLSGSRSMALKEFETAGVYKDSIEKIKEIHYQIGKELLESNQFFKARQHLLKADNYSNAKELIGSIEEKNFYNVSVKGFGGPIALSLIVDDNATILDIEIGDESFTETPGLGAKALDASFQKQFVGMRLPITLEDIDGITGATITTKAILQATNVIYREYLSKNGVQINSVEQTGEAVGHDGTIKVHLTLDIDNKITSFKIEEDGFAETPGLGGRALEKDFQNQFLGKTVPISVDDIDAIAGATITTNAIIEAINSSF